MSAAYGIDATQLTDGERVGLLANIPRIEAQRRIEKQLFDPTDITGVYDLWMLAYEDERLASEAASAAARRKVEESCAQQTR